jgi:hypothetical protein
MVDSNWSMSSTLSGAQPLGTYEGMKIMRDDSSI